MANAKYRNDFKYVSIHLDQFFARTSVKKTLNRIYEQEITGWEKWWQIEFVTWLAEHDNVGDWVMEEKFEIDGRRTRDQNHISIDVGFRLKGFSTREYLFLELKQNLDWRKCIYNMLSDAHKVFDTKKYSSTNYLKKRSFFVCGIYSMDEISKAEINDYIEIRANEADIGVERQQIHTRRIRGTRFGYTIF